MHSAEIVVVGAGPAGSAAALLLARSGRDVLLLDQARFPRDKPCGEYLNPAAIAVLQCLGLAEVLDHPRARPVAGVLLTSPSGREVRVPYPSVSGRPARGLSLPRLDLDAALLEAARGAGARAREAFRVDDLLRSGRRAVGIVGRSESRVETISARLVLAADGISSVIARRLGLASEPPRPRAIGLVAHYEGVEGDDWVEMHAGLRGYCGLGYSAGGANVAMVAAPADLPQLRGRAEAFFEERLAAFPAIAQRLSGGRRVGRLQMTGCLSSRATRVAAPGVILLGDAAGFYDPFTGEGLSYALRGAELAAEAAHAALGGDEALSNLNHTDAEDTEANTRIQPGPPAADCLINGRRRGVGRHALSSQLCLRSLCPPCLCGSTPAEAAAFRRYAARRHAEFAPRVRVSRAIQLFLQRPWALEAVFLRFQADLSLAQRLIGVTAGILPPRAVMTPAYLVRLLPWGAVGLRPSAASGDPLVLTDSRWPGADGP